MSYAIETVDLVKRYPTTLPREQGFPRAGGFGRPGGGAQSFGGFVQLIRGSGGHFLEALRGVTLQVKAGETFGILGPNGAGKTTLIKVLCTLVMYDGGEAYVDGFDVNKEPSKVLEHLQAVLPESRGFDWRLTGRQNLEFYALLYGMHEKESAERIDFLLEYTGLTERANDMFQRYSTGMQRKLLLCRALLRDTPILLFDEPTVGLDAGSAADFRRLLGERMVKEQGKTIFMSTHNLVEAQQMCDRIAIIDRGKITTCDTPDNIRYKMFDEKPFVIDFADAVYGRDEEALIQKLEQVPGVFSATPELDAERNFKGISFRVDKNMDLSTLLKPILDAGLKIGSMNTSEPSLEDAFISITGRRPEEPGFRGPRRRM